jgi:pyruvate dehydrogenase E1 component
MVYDPAFAYELAIIMEDAIDRMMGSNPEDRFWYLTLYNETYPMPALPEGPAGDAVRAGVVAGMYRYAAAPDVAGEHGRRRSVSILFSGPMWHVALDARERLANEWGVAADAYSVTSYTNLRNDAISAERWNRLNPGEQPVVPYVTGQLANGSPDGARGPVLAVSDYMRAVPDQIVRWIPPGRRYLSLGTDGFGRSDARDDLRRFFEVDSSHLVVAALAALAADGCAERSEVAEAIARYGIDPRAAEPFAV